MILFRQPLDVMRYPSGVYTNGIWVPGSHVSLSIQASVQPTSPSDLQLLPEGRRLNQTYTLYHDEELIAAVEGTGQNSDRVTISGAQFEVIATENWGNGIINHRKTIVGKVSA